MFLKDLITVTQNLLSNSMPRNMWQVDVSTIRYYDRVGLLSKAKKVSRSNVYEAEHLRELLFLKVLQYQGLSLSEIQQEMQAIKDSGIELKQVLEQRFQVADEAILAAIKGVVATEEPKIPEQREERKMIEEKEEIELWTKQPTTQTSFCDAQVTDFDGFRELNVQEQIKIGSVFAFVNTTNEEFAKKVYKLLHGQKKKGKINKASLFVGEELELPCVKLKPRLYRAAVGAIISDKDVYQEGTMAKIFALIPQAKNKKVKISTSLQHCHLDSFEIQMDKNGCAIFRLPVMTSGQYSVSLTDHNDMFTCSFEGAKYQLAPMVVSAKCEKKDNSLRTEITVTKFGAKYNGDARISLRANNRNVAQVNGKFEDGFYFVDWAYGSLPSDQLSIMVQDIEDAKLIAGTPLTGTAYHERSETEICCLGQVSSLSMVRTAGSVESRGLFFTENGVNNSPVILQNCVSNEIELKFNEDANSICIAVYDPLRKETEQYEWKNCKAGKTVKAKTTSEFSVFHLGCFFGDQPWEGHGFVARPACDNFSHAIEIPNTIEPSSELCIKVKTSKPSSLLLKVCDKRMRSVYEPVTKIGSSLKSHLDGCFPYLHQGLAQMPTVKFTSPWMLRDAEPAIWQAVSENRKTFLPQQSEPVYRYSSTPLWNSYVDQGGVNMSLTSEARVTQEIRPMFLASNHDGIYCNFNVNEDTMKETRSFAASMLRRKAVELQGVSGYSGQAGFSGCSGCSGFSGIAGGYDSLQSVPIVAPRKATQDSFYYDLLQVDREKTIKIKIPDIIGTLEVKALFISGLDWAEFQKDVAVEKPLYIEPLVPQFVDEKDDIRCRAVIVSKDSKTPKKIVLKVNGKETKFEERTVGDHLHISWKAVSGSHQIYVEQGENRDMVMRVIESPSEEVVLTQEIRLIKPKKAYSIFDEEAISITVLPGIKEELNRAISVCAQYQHCCCEQTSAKVAAAGLAIMIGDDSSKNKGIESLVAGEKRLMTLFNGNAFRYYPDSGVRYWYNKIACYRLNKVVKALSSAKLPEDAQRALNSIKVMAEKADRYEEKVRSGDHCESFVPIGSIEEAYYQGKKIDVSAKAKEFLKMQKLEGAVEEACYAVALLTQKVSSMDLAIDLANKVSKESKGVSGWFGTNLAMAYMSMIHELTKAKVLVPVKEGRIKVDGKEMSIEDAMTKSNISSIQATKNVVLIRVNRLTKLSYDDYKGKIPMVVKLDKDTLRTGDTTKLHVDLPKGYKDGDVVMVMLPDCLSRVVGGAQSKKFELDFRGSNSVSVDLAVTDKTKKPQKWGVVVRNMYDVNRIGCVGLLSVNVPE